MAPDRVTMKIAKDAAKRLPGSAALANCTATLVAAKYLPALSRPGSFWTWAYEIEIANQSAQALTLHERHWDIRPAGAHPVETTNGYGLGGEAMHIAAGETRSYISGVPLPTAEGGTMTGCYRGRWDTGDPVEIPIVVNLPWVAAADDTQQQPLEQTPKGDTRELAKVLAAYAWDCEHKGRAVLDAGELPAELGREFGKFFLGQRATGDFNSIKQGELRTTDIGHALKVFVKATALKYTDIILFGSNFNDIHVTLTFDADHIRKEEKVINQIDSFVSAEQIADDMDKKIKDLLKEAGIPKRYWPEAAAEIANVLKRISETGEPRPKYLRLASELTGAELEKRRAQERAKKATYRRSLRQRGDAPTNG